MRVVIVGPNYRDCAPFRVHLAGCADIKRDALKAGDHRPFAVDVTSKRAAVSAVYGPEAGSFYEEAGGDERHPGGLNEFLDQYIDTELRFAPCTKGLPNA